jgi:tetratricopeptide (TPR) repeat protein
MSRRLLSALALAAALLLGGAPLRAQDDLVAPARQALKAGDLSRAVALAETAVAADPASSEAHHQLGKAYGLSAKRAAIFTQLSLAKKCGAEFSRAVALDPSNLDAALDLVRFDARAPRFLGGGREKALALADEIAKRSPSRGWVARGIVAEAAKDAAGAERAYRAALAADGSDDVAAGALDDLLSTSTAREETSPGS